MTDDPALDWVTYTAGALVGIFVLAYLSAVLWPGRKKDDGGPKP